jgi:ATP-dependent Clp protease ATP-binding subunit ClpA
MNRIDKVVVFRALSEDDLRQILDIELSEVQNRIITSQMNRQFAFECTERSKEFLLKEGTDLKYGARHLKRAIERHLVFPLSNLIATGQINQADVIKVDLNNEGDKLTFCKEREMPALGVDTPNVVGYPNRKVSKVGARAVASESQVAGVDRTRKSLS